MDFDVLPNALQHSQLAGLAVQDYGYPRYRVSRFFIMEPFQHTGKALFKIID